MPMISFMKENYILALHKNSVVLIIMMAQDVSYKKCIQALCKKRKCSGISSL
jgi:hypothetical protein